MSTRRRQRRQPNPVLRVLFRLPVWIYRLRLAWLMGHRFLMITHRGRRTGKVRHTVVEVVRYDKATDEFVVASGYGATSDWYRNLQATPAIQIQVGGRRFAPVLRLLTLAEVYQEYTDYEARHPKATRQIPKLLGIEYDGTETQRRNLATYIPMIAFKPK